MPSYISASNSTKSSYSRLGYSQAGYQPDYGQAGYQSDYGQPDYAQSAQPSEGLSVHRPLTWNCRWSMFAASAFLVSVPVFFQAPLVRVAPWVSLALTLVWVGLALRLRSLPAPWVARWPNHDFWSDLYLGFAWTWLAGSIYWGWFRWEPFLHLPMEAIGVPWVIWALYRNRMGIGCWFYIGSLLGTAITDLYFYLNSLIPYWRQVMQLPPDAAPSVLANALQHIQTPWGISSAIYLVVCLLILGSFPLRSPQIQHWAFSGAILSTLLVDGLFWLTASLAT